MRRRDLIALCAAASVARPLAAQAQQAGRVFVVGYLGSSRLEAGRHVVDGFWQALRAWRGAAARARMRGIAAGIWRMLMIWRRRRQVQAARIVSLDYLDSILSPPQP